MAIELFQINWTKLYSFDNALNQPEASEGGVYALYKSTNGTKKLHYIGKSKDFTSRFGSHRQNTAHMLSEADRKKCFVSFGLISSYEKSRMSNDITPEQPRQIENYLINKVKPIGCDESTKKGYKGNPILIVNVGKITKPFEKIMTHNPDILALLKKNMKVTKTNDSGW